MGFGKHGQTVRAPTIIGLRGRVHGAAFLASFVHRFPPSPHLAKINMFQWIGKLDPGAQKASTLPEVRLSECCRKSGPPRLTFTSSGKEVEPMTPSDRNTDDQTQTEKAKRYVVGESLEGLRPPAVGSLLELQDLVFCVDEAREQGSFSRRPLGRRGDQNIMGHGGKNSEKPEPCPFEGIPIL